jgi:glycosyltransferase involved in cell wall biosynthesis/predicted O-methyltransferase YrrM
MMTESLPLVSCIMPTFDRRDFVPRAITYFQRQDYPNKQLIIVDDGTDPVADLIPPDKSIQYIHLPQRASVGAKRNLACEQSAAPLIAHWDDDDWHAPQRLRYQVDHILNSKAAICGLKDLLFFDTRDGKAWQFNYPDGQRPWLSGNSLVYTREFWTTHRFPEINVGEDGCFVWSASPDQITAMADSTFHVGVIHGKNVSPKHINGTWWRPHPVDDIRRIFGDDWSNFYEDSDCPISTKMQHVPVGSIADHSTIHLSTNGATMVVPPVRNVFACLVHERLECIVDLVRNLRYLDPSSIVLLYNGSKDPRLLDGYPFEQQGAVLHPSPRPMVWGKLHDFALDCMRYALDNFTFDTMTIVDSDQLALRSGYSQYLAEYLATHPGVGMLGNSPARQSPSSATDPAKVAFAEFELWRPLLQRFMDGEEKFPYWTFWPSTVFTAAAARDLTRLFAQDEQLKQILARSSIWATEEVILPTLTAVLGYEIGANPCSYDCVKYRCPYTPKQIETALNRHDIFWVHPITRQYDDMLRKQVREWHSYYVKPSEKSVEELPAHSPLLLTRPILVRMRLVEGWLEEDEADLLIATTARALTDIPQTQAVVEVGSYCGRATVVLANTAQVVRPSAKVWSIDPHDGRIGTAEQIAIVAPSLEKLKRNLVVAGVTDAVEVIQSHTVEVRWEQPIALLLIDGLHDYLSVARDFYHFEPWLAAGGYVGFHDYADYFPGVMAFVDELTGTKSYRKISKVRSLVILQKKDFKDRSEESINSNESLF